MLCFFQLLAGLGLFGSGGAGLAFALNQSVKASDLDLHPPTFTWSHSGILESMDVASVRRGYQVCENFL